MRKTLKRILPDHHSVHSNRWLRPFANTLLHPRLWHLNRHSAAGAVAVGLFCGLVPGPLQMLSAALACVLLRVNLPLALITTLYTNPFTIVPLYMVAYAIGSLATNGTVGGFVEPPALSGMDLAAWAVALIDWMSGLGKPLAVGLVLLASGLSVAGYFGVKAAWRIWLIRAWRRRRRSASPPAQRHPDDVGPDEHTGRNRRT
ncbi:DUF2062 domain-containing protein [Pseudothauera hydrothermalis]|uniref:DUF2062 domain-containing protein n=1 Tax=Pseudothauera hydrothermalis TaxID=2184083 RepID=UPI000E09B213|nr:DUF2062 domain-containing protein [Pseudothauera hydrothermalis]